MEIPSAAYPEERVSEARVHVPEREGERIMDNKITQPLIVLSAMFECVGIGMMLSQGGSITPIFIGGISIVLGTPILAIAAYSRAMDNGKVKEG